VGHLRPRTLSASALNVAELCLDRYKAENIDRVPRVENDAATLGTVCHAALEGYIKSKMLNPNADRDGTKDWGLLEMLYHVAFAEHFGDADRKDPRYKDGIAMLKTWLERTDLEKIDVISCEVKTNFPVKTSIGEIPFTYIWDRFDRLGPYEYKVVDYKTSKFNVSPDDLKNKIQARVYGLAAQIQQPDAERIWVEFDMLRHSPVGVVFTREDNKETWKFIKRMAERIIKEEKPEPTLNDECRFCVKRLGCEAASSNANAGGLISLDYMNNGELSNLRAEIDFQIKALKQNLGDVDSHLLSRARSEEVLSIDGDQASAEVKIRRSRSVDADRVRRTVGEEKFLQYGGVGLTISAFDNMMKDASIPEETKKKLRGLVFYETGQPYISSKRKGAF
jgi:RecB family exonuclease